MYKVAFIDIDGVVRHNNRSMPSGNYYITSIEDVMFIDGAIEAHRLLYEANIPVFWITIQNCIILGKISLCKVNNIINYMTNEIAKYGGMVHNTFVLITPDGDATHKAYEKYKAITSCQDVNFEDSFAIGDTESDINAYKWVGINNIYQVVYNEYEKCDGVIHTTSLLEAVKNYLKI